MAIIVLVVFEAGIPGFPYTGNDLVRVLVFVLDIVGNVLKIGFRVFKRITKFVYRPIKYFIVKPIVQPGLTWIYNRRAIFINLFKVAFIINNALFLGITSAFLVKNFSAWLLLRKTHVVSFWWYLQLALGFDV